MLPSSETPRDRGHGKSALHVSLLPLCTLGAEPRTPGLEHMAFACRHPPMAIWCLLLKSYRNLTSLLRLPALAPLYFASHALAPVASHRKRTPSRHWGFSWVVLRRACRIEAGNTLPMRILRRSSQRCKEEGCLLPQAGYAPYARGTRPWK
jgi:hypothetical protein